MTPPTDKLYKFLAIGGLALFIYGVTVPFKYYDNYELHRVEAIEKLNELIYAQSEFARLVNDQIGLYNKANKDGDLQHIESVKNEILGREPKIREVEKTIQRSIVQSIKHNQLLSHYENMKNIWSFIGFICILVGTISGAVGFKLWVYDTIKSNNTG